MNQVDQSAVRQMAASKLVTAPSCVHVYMYSINAGEVSTRLQVCRVAAAAKEAAANVCIRQRTLSTRYVYAMSRCVRGCV